MTIKELIKRLEQAPDKAVPVKIYVSGAGFKAEYEFDDVVNNDDCVLIGQNIPVERYERDYR